MNDITALMATMKAAAEKASNDDWVKESGDGWEATCSANDQANGGFIIAHFEGPDAAENREFVQAASPANVKTLVEALEKAQQRNTELENYAEAEAVGADKAAEDSVYWMKRCKELESRTVSAPQSDYFASLV
ncbi:ead/Ea22-like family protein, partial [Kluyvera ascorbata]|uniref:ead/Ea22-like family protein n=1 Tax=Kluyvera ascorbata TaxID=51288 RepID=UPI0039F6D358